MTPCASRRSSRSVRMFVGMPSGEAVKSLKRVRPKSRSRTISNVQRSPKMSSEHATGQDERPTGPAPLFAAGFRRVMAMPPPCHRIHLQSTSFLLAFCKYYARVPGGMEYQPRNERKEYMNMKNETMGILPENLAAE